MKEILDANYGWYFSIAVVTISTVAMLYALVVIQQTSVELRYLRETGQNGVLEGLTLTTLKSHIIRLAQLALFNTSGWIVFGVVVAGAPPEGLLLSFSRSVVLANVCLTAWTLFWGQRARRRLAEQEAKRRAENQ